MKFNKKKVGLVAAAAVAVGLAFVAIKPGAAQAAGQIVSSMIKDQTIQSRDIAAGGVGTSELRDGNTYFKDLSKGTQDLINSKASKTEVKTKNDGQDAKISSLEDRVEAEETEGDTVGLNESRAGAGYTKYAAPGYSVQFAKCPAGKVAISGGYRLNGHASEAFSGADQNAMPAGLTVVATEPAAEKGGVLVNSYQDTDFPQTEGGSFQANAWAVTFKNDGAEPLPVRVWATCVNAG